MKKFLLILTILQLSSCRWFSDASPQFYQGVSFAVPKGTPAFQEGFKHGCSAATYARGNVFYKNLNGWKYNPALIGNSEYRFGQKRGYSWCFQQALSANTGPNGSWDRVIHPLGYDKTFSTGNIGDAWNGMFGGHGGSLGHKAGGDVGGIMSVFGGAGASQTLLGSNPLYAGGSKGQIFGQ